MDSDDEGQKVAKRVLGKERNCKKLLEDDFVVLIGDAIKPFGRNQKILTTEDLIPIELFEFAVKRYLERWYPDLSQPKIKEIEQAFAVADVAKNGLVSAACEIFNKHVHAAPQEYDKMGVLQEVIVRVFARSCRAGARTRTIQDECQDTLSVPSPQD